MLAWGFPDVDNNYDDKWSIAITITADKNKTVKSKISVEFIVNFALWFSLPSKFGWKGNDIPLQKTLVSYLVNTEPNENEVFGEMKFHNLGY